MQLNMDWKCLWSALLFCFPFCGLAQMSDSLYKALPDTLKPKNKASLSAQEKLAMLANIFTYYETAPAFAAELQAIANALEKAANAATDRYFKGEAFSGLGNYYSFTNNSNKAKNCFLKAVAVVGKNDDQNDLLADAYSNLASQYYVSKDKDDSTIFYLHKSMEVKGSDKDSARLLLNYNTYSQIYVRLQLYDKAIYYGNLALNATPTNELDTKGITLTVNKAVLYQYYYASTKNKAYADSSNNILYTIIKTKKQQAENWYLVCYYHLAMLNYQLGDYERTMLLLDSAAQPAHNRVAYALPNNFRGVPFLKALTLIQLGHFEEGNSMLDTMPATRLPSRMLKYEALYKHAQKTNDWKAAFDYYTQYKAISDTLDLEGQKGHIFEAEQKYSVAQKETQIARLETTNLREKEQKRNIIFTGTGLVLLLLAAVYFIGKRQKERQQKERLALTDRLHLMEDETHLQQAKADAEKAMAMAEERRHISKNMHDEVSGSLAALQYYVADLRQNATQEESKTLLADVEREAADMYRQARSFIHNLHNAGTDAQYNVATFLANLAEKFSKGSVLRIFTEVDSECIDQYFKPLHHKEIYRIIKEAVVNTMKHSGADELHIKLFCTDGVFHLNIADNGKGIAENMTEGVGMSNLKERMQLLRGKLFIDSSSKGTTLEGIFPATLG
jgi:signal transduction histidine kinase